MYDGIKSTGAQPVHKVKADRDERNEEPAGNVRLKGCLVCVEAARAAAGVDRVIDTCFTPVALAGHIRRKNEREK